MAKVPASAQDKEKSIYKYYRRDIYEGPAELYGKIDGGFPNKEDALKIENRQALFDEGYLPGEFGYWKPGDGTGLVANLTSFPGATGEMFDWWFAWHPIDRLRYAIWDSDDHYDVYLKDRQKALDPNLSVREKHWGSVHHVWESMGGAADYISIYFKRPAQMGYDESLLDTPKCSALVCANSYIIGNDQKPDISVFMTHFMRPVQGGCELRSRFWLGWIVENGQPRKTLPQGAQIPEEALRMLLCHNVKEFNNLASFLPDIYREERNRWEP